jgi:hypothetical protein
MGCACAMGRKERSATRRNVQETLTIFPRGIKLWWMAQRTRSLACAGDGSYAEWGVQIGNQMSSNREIGVMGKVSLTSAGWIYTKRAADAPAGDNKQQTHPTRPHSLLRRRAWRASEPLRTRANVTW